MKFTFLLLLAFIIGSKACRSCPTAHKDSIRDCDKCSECQNDGGRKTNRNMNSWCKDPVCGEAYFAGKY